MIKDKLRSKKETIFVYFTLILYAIFSLICVMLHESWADEAQAWLIARDLNIVGIFKQMAYEGHSCLWHLILFPFAKLGFPYETIKYISYVFCLMAVFFILKKAPFGKITKLLLVFNPALVYIFPAIARCYCMIPLFVVWLSILYPDKEKHPYLYAGCLALLANTHLLMLPMVGMLILTFWGEKLILKRKETQKQEKVILWKSLAIALVGILFYIIQVIPAVFQCTLVNKQNNLQYILQPQKALQLIGNTVYAINVYLFRNTIGGRIVFFIVVSMLIALSCFHRKQALIFWPQILFFLFVHTFYWFIILQRTYLLLFWLIFWVWNYRYDKTVINPKVTGRLVEIMLIIMLILTMDAYHVVKKDMLQTFSTSKRAADYIERVVPKGSVFICPNDEKVCSIMPYLPKEDYQFYAPFAERYYTYVTWDNKWLLGSQKHSNSQFNQQIEKAIKNLKEQGKAESDIYIITWAHSINQLDSEKYEYEKKYTLYGAIMESYSNYENYCIYTVLPK